MANKWSPVTLEKIRNGHKKLHRSSIISVSYDWILSVINDMFKDFRKKILFVILVLSSPNLRNSRSRLDLKKALIRLLFIEDGVA